MLVKNDNASSVSNGDGDEIQGKSGVFDVPAELGQWLIRVHGFVEHVAEEISDDVKAAAEKVTGKTAPKRTRQSRAKGAAKDAPSTDGTPADDADGSDKSGDDVKAAADTDTTK